MMCSMVDVCFLCTKDSNCVSVDHRIVTQVKYVLPEITIVKFGIPLQICSICDDKLQLFSEFKQVCVESSQRVEASIIASSTNHKMAGSTSKPDETQTLETSFDRKFYDTLLQNKPTDGSMELENDSDINSDISIEDSDDEKIPQTSSFEKVKDSVFKHIPTDSEEEKDEYVIEDNTDSNKSIQTTTYYKHIATDSDVKIIRRNEFKCSFCSKVYPQKSMLTQHMKFHTGQKDHQCKICNRSFTQQIDLKRHVKSHSGVKDLPCPVCNRLFAHHSSLNRHMKVHSEIKSFECDICNKTFPRQSTLDNHVKNHEGVLQCTVCQKVFKLENNLKQHMKIHNNANTIDYPLIPEVVMDDTNIYEDFSENGEEIQSPSRRRRSAAKIWLKMKEFPTSYDAELYLNNEDTWKKTSTKKNSDGLRVEFRCKYGKYRKDECPAAIYLLYHSVDNKVTLFSTGTEHRHCSEISTRGLDENIKKVIINLFNSGVEKPNAIIGALRKDNLPEPPKRQIIAFLQNWKRKI